MPDCSGTGLVERTAGRLISAPIVAVARALETSIPKYMIGRNCE